MNLKSIDLTTGSQKAFAAVLLGVILFVLYWVTPPLVTLFKNLWYLAIYGLSFLFLVINYNNIWLLMKQLSWWMTKKIISTDKLWHMYRYYYWMQEQIAKLEESIKIVGGIKIKAERSTEELIKEAKDAASKSEAAKKQGKPDSITKILDTKLSVYHDRINSQIPRIEGMKKQYEALISLKELWVSDNEVLKIKLDSKAEEYEILKEYSKASDTASAFLRKDSPEVIKFKESLKQIENDVTYYAANIENFQRDVLPTITMMNVENTVAAEKGAKLIEEYKQKRIDFK